MYHTSAALITSHRHWDSFSLLYAVIMLNTGKTTWTHGCGRNQFDLKSSFFFGVCVCVRALSVFKYLLHLVRCIQGINVKSGVQTKYLLIRQHNNDSRYSAATFMRWFPLPPLVSSICSALRFVLVWHFQTAQYPLTEYPVTFGWIDIFSSWREFIISLHLSSRLSLKHLSEQRGTRTNGNMNESYFPRII